MSASSLPAPKVSPWLIAMVVSLATFMEVLDTTITNVSLTHIAGSLSAGQEESTWVLTSYLVANGIVLPLSGWLANVMGRKRYFMFSIALFTLASFACGAATSLGMLIFFRLLQGLAGGGLQPTQQSIILDAFPPEKRGAAFGVTGLTMIVAPILGPTLGGFITDTVGWRWIFFINIPVGFIAFMLVRKFVSDPVHAEAKGWGKIDVVGLGLVVAGLGCLQYVLDRGQQADWFNDPLISTMAAISATSLIAGVFWMLRQKDPIIELRLLADPHYALACILIFFTGFSLYASSALLPILVQSDYGYTATLAGLVISPGGLAVVVLMPIAGRLVNKTQLRYLITTGLALCGLGMLHTSMLAPELDYGTIAGMRITQVLGLPFLFIPISMMAFSHISPALNNKASAFYALVRNLGGSFGIAIVMAYTVHQQQAHRHVLVSHLGQTDATYQQVLAENTAQLTAHGVSASAASGRALGLIENSLRHQTNILAYSDAFAALGTGLLILAVLAFLLLPHNRAPQKGAPSPH